MEEINLPHLLTFNCHEAWVHQLEYVGYPTVIIDGLPGRYCHRWDLNVRPIPRGSNFVYFDQIMEYRPSYGCIIAHNLTDLLDSKMIVGPRILVIHCTLDGLIRQHGFKMEPDKLKAMVHKYLQWLGGHAVAVSSLKGRSWDLSEDIVEFGADVNQYHPWSGEIAAGLRISNQIRNRMEILLWEFHQAAFHDIPVKLVGFNPEMAGVLPSRSWEDLKSILSSHRFYIHTAHPELEDGYNMATLEAMAAGLPIIGNRHPSSPIDHGVDGFLSDDPRELNRFAKLLLANRELAGRMGMEARRKVAERFSLEKFAQKFRGSVENAQRKWTQRKASDAYFAPRDLTPVEKLGLLSKGGKFLGLATTFHDHMIRAEIDGALQALDEIMKILNLPRNREIGSLAEFAQITEEVSEYLIKLEDPRSASLLLQALIGTFSPKTSSAC
jgi:glycosyltransferase involved in cell wall biosynthesis